jgi:hypothetical protein
MFVIGVDLGQAQDFTALAVVERGVRNMDTPADLQLRHLERLPLGMDYPKVVEHVVARRRAVPGSRLVVDATGVGRPIIDLLRAAGEAVDGVSITGGARVAKDATGLYRVPKAVLVRSLSTALETGSLRIAKGLPFIDVLLRELQAFRVTIGKAGRTKFEGGKGEHDDVVLAVALAVWGADTSTRLHV